MVNRNPGIKMRLVLSGVLAGFCNGLFGSGGGMIVVPVLEKLADSEPAKAHATAIGVILPLTLVSLWQYSGFGRVDTPTLAAVCLTGVAGSFVGAGLMKKVPAGALRKFFGIMIIIAAVKAVML